jgi:hypothetical protein
MKRRNTGGIEVKEDKERGEKWKERGREEKGRRGTNSQKGKERLRSRWEIIMTNRRESKKCWWMRKREK